MNYKDFKIIGQVKLSDIPVSDLDELSYRLEDYYCTYSARYYHPMSELEQFLLDCTGIEDISEMFNSDMLSIDGVFDFSAPYFYIDGHFWCCSSEAEYIKYFELERDTIVDCLIDFIWKGRHGPLCLSAETEQKIEYLRGIK